MRTRAPSYDRAGAIQSGHLSARRAGTGGIPTVTDEATDVDDVDTLHVYGGDVQGNENDAYASYRSLIAWVTNQSGGDLVAGSVVIVDTANDDAVTTTTTAQSTLKVGIVREGITDGTVGPVTIGGYAPLVLVTASVTRGHYLEPSTTAGQATANSARRAGSFGQLLTGGTTPTALLFDSPEGASYGAHYEILMASGSADPLLTPDGLDYLYVEVF